MALGDINNLYSATFYDGLAFNDAGTVLYGLLFDLGNPTINEIDPSDGSVTSSGNVFPGPNVLLGLTYDSFDFLVVNGSDLLYRSDPDNSYSDEADESFSTTHENSDGITWDGTNYWVASTNDDGTASSLDALTGTGGLVRSIDVTPNIFSNSHNDQVVYLGAARLVYIADDLIAREIDLDTEALVQSFDLSTINASFNPEGLAFFNDELYIHDNDSDTIYVLDWPQPFGTVEESYGLQGVITHLAWGDSTLFGVSGPAARKYNIDDETTTDFYSSTEGDLAGIVYLNGSLWIIAAEAFGGFVRELDPSDMTSVGTVDIDPAIDDPNGIATDGINLYIANNGDSTIYVVDPSSGDTLNTYPVIGGISDITFALGRIYILSGLFDTLRVFDIGTETFGGPGNGFENFPDTPVGGIAYAPGMSFFYSALTVNPDVWLLTSPGVAEGESSDTLSIAEAETLSVTHTESDQLSIVEVENQDITVMDSDTIDLDEAETLTVALDDGDEIGLHDAHDFDPEDSDVITIEEAAQPFLEGFRVFFNESLRAPGFTVELLGLQESTENFHTIDVFRRDPSGRYPDRRVRGLASVLVEDNNMTVTDYEAPLNVPLEYHLRLTSNSGVFVRGPIIPTPQAFIPTLGDAYGSGIVFLKVVDSPSLSLPLLLEDGPRSWDHSGRVQGQYQVLGRKNPVVITDVLGGREGSFSGHNVLRFGQSLPAFRRALAPGSTLLLQNHNLTMSAFEDMYFKVESVSFDRRTSMVYHGELDNPSNPEVITTFNVSYIEVDRPNPVGENVPSLTWQIVLDTHCDWEHVLEFHGDEWFDVLVNPNGPGCDDSPSS